MASMLAILLFGIIKINGQGIPPPQFPVTGQQPPPQSPVIVPQPTPPPPPPVGYQGIGCPNKDTPCPAGKYRNDAVTIGTALYGCFCTCPYTLARDCMAIGPQMMFNWDACACQLTPAPTTAPPTTAPPTTGAPTTPAPTFPRVFPQPGVPAPPIAPMPGQIPPAPGSWNQPPGPPMGGPGQLPGWNVGPAPAVPLGPATTWAPGVTEAPMDGLCGADPISVLSFTRRGNRISMEIECVPTTTTTTMTPI
eukprot:CAMPEP_0201565402 /NCGR_PEP_ID=MMETSP0190_2-20130828/4505_1 /ASSEMBLY_ACC=CAM_ASM_000263 /TAXON_ID=37353 /ORGANISM="Rosalina sp." /LENGTH=249 /DNA_ID=CAMNT_0047982847 /DNA_START=53 /DNA_END=802 /DNA_ORIENTATION=+